MKTNWWHIRTVALHLYRENVNNNTPEYKRVLLTASILCLQKQMHMKANWRHEQLPAPPQEEFLRQWNIHTCSVPMTKFYLSTQISVLLQSQCVPLLFTSPTTFSIIYIAGTKDKLPERPQEPNQSQRNTTSHNHIDTLGFTLYSSCSKQCKGRKMQRTSGELKVKCLEREGERERETSHQWKIINMS